MDDVAHVINDLHEGRRVDISELDWKTRVKFLRLQIVAAYAGCRLLILLGRIRDAEFMEVFLSSIEDSDPLLDDALAYGLEKNVVALASFLQAVAVFAWYKAVEVRPFFDLCPHLSKRLDEIEGYVEGVKPDSRLVHAEEILLEHVYAAHMMIIKDYPQ